MIVVYSLLILFSLVIVSGLLPTIANIGLHHELRAQEIHNEALRKQEEARQDEDLAKELADDQDELISSFNPISDESFIHQCYLTEFLEIFAAQGEKKVYKNFSLIQDKDPALVLSKMNSKKGVAKFFDIKPHQVAALQPMIRLFKVYKNVDGDPTEVKELKFKDVLSNKSVENITKSRFGRGDGVGIKSLSVETRGVNPAMGGWLKASLTLHFQNIEMLVRKGSQFDGGDGRRNPSFLDLIWRSTPYLGQRDISGRTIEQHREANPDFFQIMLVYGWNTPTGSLEPGPPSNKDLKNALKKCVQVLWLNLTNHSIDFKQDGTVELSVDYEASVQSVLRSSLSDIFLLGKDSVLEAKRETMQRDYAKAADRSLIEKNTHNIKNLERDLEALKKKNDAAGSSWFSSNLTSEEQAKQKNLKVSLRSAKTRKKTVTRHAKKAKDDLGRLDNKIRMQKYSKILSRLEETGSIYYVDLTEEMIVNIRDGYFTSEKGKLPPPTADGMSIGTFEGVASAFGDVKKKIEEQLANKVNPDKKEQAGVSEADKPVPKTATRLNYFYFGDLIEIAAEVIKQNKPSPKISIITGPLSYRHPISGKRKSAMNLADIPISLDLFLSWFNKKVVRELKDKWFLKDFIHDVLHDLVVPALGVNCYKAEVGKIDTIGLYAFTAAGMGKGKKSKRVPLGRQSLSAIEGVADLLPDMAPPRIKFDDYHHYLFFYVKSEVPDMLDPRDRKRDEHEGRYHLTLGADRGVVKTINFNKTDNPHLPAARLTTEDSELGQLRDKYDAKISMVGNPLFIPGQKIYVNPTVTGLGSTIGKNSIARQLGLGGYYDVIKVVNSLDSTGFKTDIDCVWVSFGNDGQTFGSIPTKPTADTSYDKDTGTMYDLESGLDIPAQAPSIFDLPTED